MNSVYGEELELFRHSLRTFFRKEIEPHAKKFEGKGVDRETWLKAGRAGLLGVCVPREYGGAGDDGLALVIGTEEVGYSRAGSTVGAFMGTDICTLFLVNHGTEAQKRHWFPTIMSGETIMCMAVTEPDAGSDVAATRTSAVRDGDEYVINGSKCFLSNANKADLIFLIAKTDLTAGSRGLSVIMVPGDTPGVTRGRMTTMGYPGGDVGELSFDNVRVPVSNLLGQEGRAMKMFQSTMVVDRLMVCGRSMGNARLAFEMTLEYVRNRKIFGQRVVDFQNTQFELAKMEIDIDVGRACMNDLIGKFRDGTFTDRDGWRSKVWFSEMEGRVLDACVQFWGGNGWMDEMPISRMYTAARLQRIHAGSTELSKSLMGRSYLREG